MSEKSLGHVRISFVTCCIILYRPNLFSTFVLGSATFMGFDIVLTVEHGCD